MKLSKFFIGADSDNKQSYPPFALSLTPVVFLLLSLAAIIVFAGSEAISEFSPMILAAAGILAIIISAISGSLSAHGLKDGMRRSAKQILPAVPLLLLIALISTTWLMSGVVPTLVCYGIDMLNPTLFLATTCAVCAVVSILTGSSWTTIATIGVAFIGIGRIMGYSEGWIAGAIISGAYFGDKISPLSDTTVIAASGCGVDLFEHIRYLMYTTLPAITIAMAVFGAVGIFCQPIETSDSMMMVDALHEIFKITPLTLIIPLIVGTMIALRVKTLITLAVGSILGVAGIVLFQPDLLPLVSGTDTALATGESAMTLLRILWTQTTLSTGSAELDAFATTGGILGMMPTVTLVLCAMFFGGAMIGTGMLRSIADRLTRPLNRRSHIVSATVGSGLMLNAATADQYLSIIIGANIYRSVYQRFGLPPRLLSRTLEDSVSVTSVLIPWNSCGVTQSTVLGVATLTYLPYCIFNLLSPVVTLVFAWTGYKIHSIKAKVQRA